VATWLNAPFVKYVGHHCPADLPVMHHILGLNGYRKVAFDTEFAQQTADEFAELKLERLCMAYPCALVCLTFAPNTYSRLSVTINET